MNKPHFLCEIFGHKWVDKIDSKSIFFADNLLCGRCKIWSNNFPDSFYKRFNSNGFFPEMKGRIRGLTMTVFAFFRRLFPTKLPF
jgi:hypothetical protein